MLEFRWNMDENEWKRLRDVQLNHTETLDNYFGSVECGAIKVEFCHTIDESAWFPYTNVFCYGYDNDYGILDNGVAYGDIDWDFFGDAYKGDYESYLSYDEFINFFLGETFEEFKRRVQNTIHFAIYWDGYAILQEYCKKPFGDWR